MKPAKIFSTKQLKTWHVVAAFSGLSLLLALFTES